MTRGHITIIVAVLCFSCAVCAAEKCPPSDVQYDGLYVCWDADAIAAFEDLSVTDNPPTSRTAAIFSGPDTGRYTCGNCRHRASHVRSRSSIRVTIVYMITDINAK